MALAGPFDPRAVKAAPVPCCRPSWPYLGSAMTLTDAPTPPRHAVLDTWATALLKRITAYARARRRQRRDRRRAASPGGRPPGGGLADDRSPHPVRTRRDSRQQPTDRELLNEVVARDAAPTSEAGRR